MSPPQGPGRDLAEAETADLAGGDETGHGADRLLDRDIRERDIRIGAVRVIKIDVGEGGA